MARCLSQLWKQADTMILRYHSHGPTLQKSDTVAQLKNVEWSGTAIVATVPIIPRYDIHLFWTSNTNETRPTTTALNTTTRRCSRREWGMTADKTAHWHYWSWVTVGVITGNQTCIESPSEITSNRRIPISLLRPILQERRYPSVIYMARDYKTS